MLKIQPINTKINNNFTGNRLQIRKPDSLLCSLPVNNQPKTDIFQYQKTQDVSFIDKISNISFGSNKANKQVMTSDDIAKKLNGILKGEIGAVSTEDFQRTYNKINEKNVISTIKAYDRISPNETLIGAISKESADSEDTRKDAVKGILDKLVTLGKTAGVQTEHYRKNFAEEWNEQFDTVLLPVKAKQLDKISAALVQAIENKKSLSEDEKLSLKKANLADTQTYTSKILSTSVKKAEKSMAAQDNYDGWSAKLGESIRALWGSKNQKDLVNEDVDKFKSQVVELNKLVGTKEYNKKFKEIFNIDYDPELIATYKQKEEKYVMASVCVAVENNFKKSVKNLLSEEPITDEYIMPALAHTATLPVLVKTKKEIYNEELDAFSEFVGKGNKKVGRAQILKTMSDYRITKDSTLSDKCEVLQKMAKKYAEGLHQNTKNITGKKDIKEMKREYDNSYYAAFGVENDIAKRVEDYRNSQMWSELLVQDTILGAASVGIWMATAGTGIIPTLKIAAAHSGAAAGLYTSDRLSSKQGVTEKDIKEILMNTAIDGATAIANQLAYKGIEVLVSPIAKMSGTAAKVSEFALSTASDLAIDSGFEYVATGKVTLQGVVYSVAFSAGGQILDFRTENYQRKSL